MKYERYPGELSHHGILGMKWGKRNGPPYPLGYSDRSASEKKQAYLSDELKISDKDLHAYRHEMMERYDGNIAKKQYYKKASDKELREDINRKAKLKKIAIGVGVTAGLAAGVYFAYKYNAVEKLGKSMVNGNLDKKTAKNIMNDCLDDADIILKKGTVFHRVTGYSGIDYSKVNTLTYTSHLEKDRAFYKSEYFKDWHGTGERFEYEMEAIKDIRMPSKDKALKLFDEMMKENPIYREKLTESLVDSYKEKMPGLPDFIIKSAVNSQMKSDVFGQGIYSMVLQGEDSKIMVDYFQKKGYNAINDFFDMNAGIADSPVILFDPSNTIRQNGFKKVSEMDKLMSTRIAGDMLRKKKLI